MKSLRRPLPQMQHVPIPIDERDHGDQRDPDTVAGKKGGRSVAAVTAHIPGVTRRDTVYRMLHDQVHSAVHRTDDLDERSLCGVEHVEDIALWQAPHTGRAELRRFVQHLERKHRRPVVIVHGWQHIGPCPTTDAPAAQNGA
jgi:hypothetical protein